jgi:phosphoserine phosphatase RsbU/P
MSAPRLSVADLEGTRAVPIDKPVFLVGRRTTADLRIPREDVSREHAQIERTGDQYLLSDLRSRFGTFVNGELVTAPRPLVHGDRIRFGLTDSAEATFLFDEGPQAGLTDGPAEMSDLRQMAAILNGLRALGSGRVLDEVLALVLGSALDVTEAERGFIMLASPGGALQFRTGRTKGGVQLSGSSFATSQKIPRAVFETSKSQMVSDLMDSDVAEAHGHTIATGIRNVLCVPLRVAPFGPSSSDRTTDRVIGVLYLDGRERGRLLSATTVTSLEAFATQAALAIESARLYAESAEKAKLDRDLRVAADIQRALLPEPRWKGTTLDLSASTVPCRTVGGDFFDYLELEGGAVGFTLGDVAGKGPPAALLAATVQSHFAANAPIASDPADLMARLNRALLRRAVEARFATMFYGVLSATGELAYTNAGQEPPIVVRASGELSSLDVGGPVMGLLPGATYQWAQLSLAPGDIVAICSDGVTEACNPAGDEYGRDRLAALLASVDGDDPDELVDRVLASVTAFAGTEPQGDDVTLMVLRYRGSARAG